MYIKIIGSLFVFLCAFFLSRLFSTKMKRRKMELSQISNFLEDIITYIDLGSYDIPFLISDQINKTRGDLNEFLIKIYENIIENKQCSIEDMWAENIDKISFTLNKEDTMNFLLIGGSLSLSDKEILLNQLQGIKVTISSSLQEAKEDVANKAVLYEKLGILGGLFLIILFF